MKWFDRDLCNYPKITIFTLLAILVLIIGLSGELLK